MWVEWICLWFGCYFDLERERERRERVSDLCVRACLCVWVGLFVWVKISEWGECECVKELVWVFVCLFELLIVVNIELVNQWIKLQLCDWVSKNNCLFVVTFWFFHFHFSEKIIIIVLLYVRGVTEWVGWEFVCDSVMIFDLEREKITSVWFVLCIFDFAYYKVFLFWKYEWW
jgi:hypothetical protein